MSSLVYGKVDRAVYFFFNKSSCFIILGGGFGGYSVSEEGFFFSCSFCYLGFFEFFKNIKI